MTSSPGPHRPSNSASHSASNSASHSASSAQGASGGAIQKRLRSSLGGPSNSSPSRSSLTLGKNKLL